MTNVAFDYIIGQLTGFCRSEQKEKPFMSKEAYGEDLSECINGADRDYDCLSGDPYFETEDLIHDLTTDRMGMDCIIDEEKEF